MNDHEAGDCGIAFRHVHRGGGTVESGTNGPCYRLPVRSHTLFLVPEPYDHVDDRLAVALARPPNLFSRIHLHSSVQRYRVQRRCEAPSRQRIATAPRCGGFRSSRLQHPRATAGLSALRSSSEAGRSTIQPFSGGAKRRPLRRRYGLGRPPAMAQAASASSGGPRRCRPEPSSADASLAQSGHTIISCATSVPIPPGSSECFSRPSRLNRFALGRAGYSRGLVSTTREVAATLGGTTLRHS